jgi:DNA polymerase/3'-5' exonuclease PolX
MYYKLFNIEFFITGSVGRNKYFKQIYEKLSKISETLPKILLEDKKLDTKKDIDLLYFGKLKDILDIIKKKYSKNVEIIQIKKDLLMLKVGEIRYDIFVCEKKEDFYSYYLFSLIGKRLNIILRKKAKNKNLLLNQHGLYDLKTNEKIKIYYNNNQGILENIYKIIKKIYNF